MLLVFALAACTGVDGPQVRADLPIEPRFEGLAAQIEAERVASGTPGVAALLIENGEVVFAHGFGNRHPTSSAHGPVTAATLFRIGSVTKVLTAAAFLRFVEDGEATLDQPITELIPDFALARPEWASSIQTQHLLTHASGIVDYIAIDAPPGEQTDDALDDVITGPAGRDAYLMAPSGRMWNYSNPNFYLLGLAVERLAGKSYVDAMHDRVFAPLEMTRTFFRPREVTDDGDFAWGKTAYDPSGVVAPDSYENPWARPAGYAFSSVWDLAQFARFLLQGQDDVLGSAQRQAMMSPQISTETYFELTHYGYGLFINEGFTTGSGHYQSRVVSHGGDIPGYAASMFLHPASGMAFITLASADGAHFNQSAAYVLDELATLPAPIDPPVPDLGPAVLATFAGEYFDEFNAGRVIITAGASGLTISMPDVDAVGVSYDAALRPYSDRTFVLTVQGYLIAATFILDSEGNAEYFRTRPFVAARAPGSQPAIHVDRERLLEQARRASFSLSPN